jgi:asparagine synthase (glutamine-hydrolysing)
MCGINGFNFFDPDLIRKQSRVTSHRGPDDEGIYTDPNVSLGHNRLAIIDLSAAGHQPMLSSDGRYVIVYNGELYNYQILRKSLIKKGAVFLTKTDTEVILQSYIYFGKDCLRDFEGIFAFAIWDKKKKELFLARDRFGVKPLFYYFDGKKLIFSSEVKGILEHDIPREINKRALATFFRLLYINGPETILKNIYKVQPASYLIYKEGSIFESYFLEATDYSDKYSKREAEEMIRERLTNSVKEQMVADVPVGVFLSGGIDSSIILSLAREASTERIKTFSVGFDLPEPFFQRFNEDYLLAKKTAEYHGTEHFDILLGEAEVAEKFEQVVWHMDDLVYSPTQIANYALAEMASKEVKVVLGGDGGDELFGGYARYYYYYLVNYWQSLPESARKSFLIKKIFNISGKENLLARANMSAPDLFWSFMAQKEEKLSRILDPSLSDSQIAKDFFFSNPFVKEMIGRAEIDLAKRMMVIDRGTWLVDFSLVRSDKMSMAHGLEQRVPFLDQKLLEISNGIPSRLKIASAEQGKKILKSAMQAHIPDFLRDKQKTGWFSPAAKWLRAGLKSHAQDILSDNYNQGRTAAYVDLGATRQLLEEHNRGQGYALNPIWSVMTFQVWYKHFMSK